jgi:hypothetical protein
MPPQRRRSERRRIAGLQLLVRDTSDNLHTLIDCWRAHVSLVEAVLEIERESTPPSVRYCQFGDLDDADRNADGCAISRTQFEDETHICVLPCGHYFNAGAGARWVSRNETCPLCREPVMPQFTERVRVVADAWDGSEVSPPVMAIAGEGEPDQHDGES